MMASNDAFRPRRSSRSAKVTAKFRVCGRLLVNSCDRTSAPSGSCESAKGSKARIARYSPETQNTGDLQCPGHSYSESAIIRQLITGDLDGETPKDSLKFLNICPEKLPCKGKLCPERGGNFRVARDPPGISELGSSVRVERSLSDSVISRLLGSSLVPDVPDGRLADRLGCFITTPRSRKQRRLLDPVKLAKPDPTN
jgi:hypothetical protein